MLYQPSNNKCMLTNSFLVVLDVVAGEPLKSKISLFLCLILSFFFSLMFLPQILNISRRKQLYDTPNRRKCHHERIPRLGGLAFFPSIVLSMSLVVGYRYLIGFQMNHQLNGNILLEFLFLSIWVFVAVRVVGMERLMRFGC